MGLERRAVDVNFTCQSAKKTIIPKEVLA